jgi:light-regulated signal transduction histidine kinase (bacteriophytochrome)
MVEGIAMLSSEWARLLLAYDETGRIKLEPDGQRFFARELMPDGFLHREKRYTVVIKPLYFQESQLGFVMFDVGPPEGEIYETLSGQISSALASTRLLEKHQQAVDTLAYQARELARSNAELEQFAYVVSHDLQEPLRMVHSYLQLLQQRYRGQLDENADEFIAFAVNGAARMHNLIRDLLLYSRVETKGQSFEPTDCAVVLQAVLANLQTAIEENQARITYDDLPTVIADEVQLTQLLQNLLGNAIKFRSTHPPQIHLSVESRDNEWLFSVRDNGIGIQAEYSKRIFMIFQRLHTSEEYQGTGIGLAICEKIVERHGGRIWVESALGKGATFCFTIPDREEDVP